MNKENDIIVRKRGGGYLCTHCNKILRAADVAIHLLVIKAQQGHLFEDKQKIDETLPFNQRTL